MQATLGYAWTAPKIKSITLYPFPALLHVEIEPSKEVKPPYNIWSLAKFSKMLNRNCVLLKKYMPNNLYIVNS